MAFDRKNDVFYKTFAGGDGKSYTIYFYPGYHEDIVTENQVEFPNDVIFNECKVNGEIPDNLPWGLEKARTLKLKFYLKGFDNSTWGEVATWMLDTQSTSIRSVNSIDMYIPNRWKLYNNTNSRVEFDGFQSATNKEKLEIDANGEYELECIGAYKTILELVDLNAIDFGTAYHTRTNKNIYDLDYRTEISLGVYRSASYSWEDYAGMTYHFYRMRDIFQSMRDYAKTIMQTFFRDGANPNYEMFDIDGIDDVWSFFKQQISDDESHPYISGALEFAGLMVCGKIDFDGDDRGGFFADGTGIKGYNNCWSFLRQLCDSLLLKIRFDYASDPYFRAKFYNPFTSISTNQDIEATDKNKFTVNRKPLLVTQTGCYILGAQEGDDSEIKLVTVVGNIDGDSDESELIFNNYLLGYFKTDQFNNEFKSDSFAHYQKKNESLRTLYYKEVNDNVYKIHEHCEYDLGGSVTVFTPDSTYTTAPYKYFPTSGVTNESNSKIIYDYNKDMYAKRLAFYGMAYIRNLVIKYVRGDLKHAVLEGKLSNYITTTSDVSITQLGNTYDVAIDSMTNISAISNFPTIAILTYCDYDYIKGESDAKFFMRGDS